MSISFYGGIKTETGHELVSVDSNINVCNRNAELILGTLGFVGNIWDIPAVELDTMFKKVFLALNKKKNHKLGIDTVVTGGETSVKLTEFGITDDYIPEMLSKLLLFIKNARTAGITHIYWG